MAGTQSPFGNGNGGGSGGRAGPNNFVSNPGGGGGAGKGRDLLTTQSPPNTTGVDANPDTVPAGGTIPIVESPEPAKMPFKLGNG